MAITGIDTIEGKQIIAAGAVSAKSAEMAYNDENGNPITGYQVAGDYLTTADSANFYTTANPSGFISEVPTGTMNESAFEYDENDKISGYNGSAFAGGSDVPEGVMVESGLEYNAVNEISGYNGSAIAQYGAEKQWLVHDDTLVHASNSAQYALGVNISAIAQLLGVDETILFDNSGEPYTGNFTTPEPLSAFNEVAFYVATNPDEEGPTKVVIPMIGRNNQVLKLGWVGTFNGWHNIVWQYTYNNTGMTAFQPVSGSFFGSNATHTAEQGSWLANSMNLYKVIGIGHKGV